MALSTAEWLEREAEKEVSRLRDIPYRTGEVAVLFGIGVIVLGFVTLGLFMTIFKRTQ